MASNDQHQLSRAFAELVDGVQETQRMVMLNERRILCRLTSIKRDRHGRRGHTLRNWRTRNRLYLRTSDGRFFPVPDGHGTSNMIKLMENGRLYLLTNGIH